MLLRSLPLAGRVEDLQHPGCGKCNVLVFRLDNKLTDPEHHLPDARFRRRSGRGSKRK